jgi:UDP-glucose 6-dehydrogenase
MYEHVREMMGHDRRIGMSWLDINHGSYCGAGGYCFPKDMNAFIYFVKELMKLLKKDKKTDPGLIRSLEAGLKVLNSIHNYNVQLLKWQGLTLEEVSYHNNKLKKEPKKIRE